MLVVFVACDVLTAPFCSLTAQVGSILSVSLLAQLLLGDSCSLINHLLRRYFSDVIPDGLCYGIETLPQMGFWCGLGCCILLIMCSNVIVTLGYRCTASHGGFDDEGASAIWCLVVKEVPMEDRSGQVN